jgi:hypothetical protein
MTLLPSRARKVYCSHGVSARWAETRTPGLRVGRME